MDRGRRAEPYSNATIWTREVAKNLASHLHRVSNAHSCVDTKSPKSSHLPQFQNGNKSRNHSSPLIKKREKERQEAIESNSIRKPVPSISTTAVDVPSSEVAVSQNDKEPLVTTATTTITTATTTTNTGSLDTRREDDEKSPNPQQQQHSHHPPVKHLKPITKREMMENERQEAIALENQRLHERLEKIAIAKDPKRTQQDSSSYDTAAVISRKNLLNDANRKREQLKIYQENQALVKRLRNAKPTLKAKDWENHEKWNQEFLKKAEKRRQALQQELQKFQPSPQAAVVKMKQMKHSHKKTAFGKQGDDEADDEEEEIAVQQVESPNSPVQVTLSPQKKKQSKAQSKHSDFKKKHQQKQAHDDSDASTTIAADAGVSSAAANHRRIMLLRQQHASRSSPPTSSHGSRKVSPRGDDPEEQVQEQEELVSVRFTFSREEKSTPKEEGTPISTEAKAKEEEEEKPITKTKTPPSTKLEEPPASAIVAVVTNSDPIPKANGKSGSSISSSSSSSNKKDEEEEGLEESGVYDVSFEEEATAAGGAKQQAEPSKSEESPAAVEGVNEATDSTLTPLTAREEYEKEEFDEATQDGTVPDLTASTAATRTPPAKATSQEDEPSIADYDNEFELDVSSPTKVPTPRVSQSETSKEPVEQEKKVEQEEIGEYSQDEYEGDQEEEKAQSPRTKVEEELEYSHDGFES